MLGQVQLECMAKSEEKSSKLTFFATNTGTSSIWLVKKQEADHAADARHYAQYLHNTNEAVTIATIEIFC